MAPFSVIGSLTMFNLSKLLPSFLAHCQPSTKLWH